MALGVGYMYVSSSTLLTVLQYCLGMHGCVVKIDIAELLISMCMCMSVCVCVCVYDVKSVD